VIFFFSIIPEVQLPTAGKTISAREKFVSARCSPSRKKTETKIRESRFSLRRIERFVDKLSHRYLSMTVRDDIVDYSNANDSYIIRTRPHKFNSIQSIPRSNDWSDSHSHLTNPYGPELTADTHIYTVYTLIYVFVSNNVQLKKTVEKKIEEKKSNKNKNNKILFITDINRAK